MPLPDILQLTQQNKNKDNVFTPQVLIILWSVLFHSNRVYHRDIKPENIVLSLVRRVATASIFWGIQSVVSVLQELLGSHVAYPRLL